MITEEQSKRLASVFYKAAAKEDLSPADVLAFSELLYRTELVDNFTDKDFADLHTELGRVLGRAWVDTLQANHRKAKKAKGKREKSCRKK